MTRRNEDDAAGLWSLQVLSRQIARKARRLVHAHDTDSAVLAAVERHLDAVGQLLASHFGNGSPVQHDPQGIVALTQMMLRHSPAAAAAELHTGPAAPSCDHELLLHARLGRMSTADLIGFLCSAQQTGILQVLTDEEDFTIEIEHGDVVHAHSDAAPEGARLGDILVEQGVMTTTALTDLLRQHQGPSGAGERLGQLAQQEEGVGHTELLAALETQIERLFCRLFRSSPREFLFWAGPCLDAERSMRLNANRLLLEAACSLDETRGAG